MLKTLYIKVRDHLIKILSAIGVMLVSLDLAGYADEMKAAADHYLGANAGHKIGIALFVLMFLRASYVTWAQRKS